MAWLVGHRHTKGPATEMPTAYIYRATSRLYRSEKLPKVCFSCSGASLTLTRSSLRLDFIAGWQPAGRGHLDALTAWLQALGLERYAQVLAESEVDLEALRLPGEPHLPPLTSTIWAEHAPGTFTRMSCSTARIGQLPRVQRGKSTQRATERVGL